jgi:hypothetical protein
MMLELFAQVGKNNPNAAPPPDPAAAAAAGGMALIMVLLYVVLIIAQILFLLALSKCFKEISPRNRTMEPGQVWLNLIPLFGTVWIFLTVLKLSESLENEFRYRGRPQEGDYGKTLGLVFLISGFICGCVTPVVWIMYWIKVAGFTKLLQSTRGKPRKRRVEEDEDEEEERPRPKKRRPRDDDEDE